MRFIDYGLLRYAVPELVEGRNDISAVIARSPEGDVAIHNGNSLMSKKLDG